MATEMKPPEIFYTTPTAHCPNSPLPILVYRSIIPPDLPITQSSIKDLLESNNWIHGGTFKHYPTAHFHSNTHEAYAVLEGRTRCLYGIGPLDGEEAEGVVFEMGKGDLAVHAAGVAHRNTWSSPDYEYMGLYPKGSPKWDNNFCKADAEETAERKRAAEKVQVPEWDPVYGLNGPLPTLWKQAAAA